MSDLDVTYILAAHTRSGEVYVLRYLGDEVDGYAGPLFYRRDGDGPEVPLRLGSLDNVGYTTEALDWAREEDALGRFRRIS